MPAHIAEEQESNTEEGFISLGIEPRRVSGEIQTEDGMMGQGMDFPAIQFPPIVEKKFPQIPLNKVMNVTAKARMTSGGLELLALKFNGMGEVEEGEEEKKPKHKDKNEFSEMSAEPEPVSV